MGEIAKKLFRLIVELVLEVRDIVQLAIPMLMPSIPLSKDLDGQSLNDLRFELVSPMP